ncbi:MULTISPECIES: hypothetical protein [Mycolicibacterium]|uniref:Polyketide cyclase n=7 Tax=Mycolicibacterium TaxID=1866885 RepID=A0A6H0S0F2_9MYCO|nr:MULTISPECIES: hypothetical protein [Mycolicibacterium]ABP43174.1 conserved hypothetical protein [Mycolicibacterium gilvum PYR-GCK]APE17828.1 hypothetical protein BOH72_23765 [Mycobacterium sp. WY10]ABM11308.1 conserved hypothetical protein [Mycolicibacterium vanbaalenii PYR-1]ADT96867.1 hypothetical protein Mspyr1_01380 [Mycolicibacterium gilvum Spyr1]MBV5246674.1 hypothetical protein [Mycolicibacterium sp. PAM1]
MTSEETEADRKVPGGAPDLPGFIATIDLFLRLEKRRKSEPMFAAVLTDDFQIGFRGGHQWKGRDGLQVYLNQRDGIFDERLELRHVLSYVPVNEGVVELTTRLEFYFRRWKAPALVSEEFTGSAFRTWLIRIADDEMRVKRVIIDGFANLNENARTVFAIPDEGFDE